VFFTDPGAISTSGVLAYPGTLRALDADLAWFRGKPLRLLVMSTVRHPLE
jgi:hypothetical protein